MRIAAKVRGNPDFDACTAYLDRLGYAWAVLPPRGKGHPKLSVTLPNGATYEHPIACSPRGSLCKERVVACLKRGLAKALRD